MAAWLDAVFVPRCLGCGRAGSHFCGPCTGALRAVPAPWCAGCGRPLAGPPADQSALPGAPAPPLHPPPGGAGPLVCPECRRPLVLVRSVALFEGPLRRAVHRLKYRGRPGAARVLADLLVPSVRELLSDAAGRPPPLILPLPLHPDRERARGYNQALLLARPLAGRLALPCRPDQLRRVRPTAPQVGLSRAARRLNVAGAFAPGPGLAGQTVVLVDDVATTGSTLESAGAACLAGGALAVYAVTLAREP